MNRFTGLISTIELNQQVFLIDFFREVQNFSGVAGNMHLRTP